MLQDWESAFAYLLHRSEHSKYLRFPKSLLAQNNQIILDLDCKVNCVATVRNSEPLCNNIVFVALFDIMMVLKMSTWSPAWPSSTAFRADLSTLIAVGLFLKISRHHFIVSCSKLSNWTLQNGIIKIQFDIYRILMWFLRQKTRRVTHWYNFVNEPHFFGFWCCVESCQKPHFSRLLRSDLIYHTLRWESMSKYILLFILHK